MADFRAILVQRGKAAGLKGTRPRSSLKRTPGEDHDL